MQVGVIGVLAAIVRVVVSTVCVAVSVAEVRRFKREVAVFVDAQDHPVGSAEATAHEDRCDESEDDDGPKLHEVDATDAETCRQTARSRATRQHSSSTSKAALIQTSIAPASMARRRESVSDIAV